MPLERAYAPSGPPPRLLHPALQRCWMTAFIPLTAAAQRPGLHARQQRTRSPQGGGPTPRRQQGGDPMQTLTAGERPQAAGPEVGGLGVEGGGWEGGGAPSEPLQCPFHRDQWVMSGAGSGGQVEVGWRGRRRSAGRARCCRRPRVPTSHQRVSCRICSPDSWSGTSPRASLGCWMQAPTLWFWADTEGAHERAFAGSRQGCVHSGSAAAAACGYAFANHHN